MDRYWFQKQKGPMTSYEIVKSILDTATESLAELLADYD